MGTGEEEEDLSPAPAARLHLLFLTQRRKDAEDAKEKKGEELLFDRLLLNKMYFDVFLQPVAAEIQLAQLWCQRCYNS
jgi:gamma-glutamyl phosphate reductase